MLVGALLPGCGGSSGPAPAPAAGTPPVTAGLFAGTVSSTSEHGVADPTYAVVLGDGTFRTLSESLLQASGTLNLGSSSASGNATLFAPANFNFGGDPTLAVSIQGSLGSDLTFNLTFLDQGGSGAAGSIQLSPDQAASAPIQAASLAGTYAAQAHDVSTGVATTFTVDAQGGITSTDTDHALTGQLVQLAAASNGFNNAFAVNLTYTPAGASAQTFTGLAFRNPDPAGLVLMLDDGTNATAATAQFSGIFNLENPSAPPEPPVSLAGIWTGTVTDQAAYSTVQVTGLILADGTFRTLDANYAQVSATLAQGSQGGLSASGTIYAPGTPFQSAAISFTGSYANGAATASISAPFPGSLSVTYDPVANIMVGPADLAGTYVAHADANSAQVLTSVTLAADGGELQVSGEMGATGAPQATLTGIMTQTQPWANAFTVSLLYQPAAGGEALALSGLAFLQPNGFLVLMLDDATGTTPATFQFCGTLNLQS